MYYQFGYCINFLLIERSVRWT